MTHLLTVAATLAFLTAGSPAPSTALVPGPAQDPATQSAPNDRAVNPAQPDFTIVGLPTTLRVPRFGSSFRVTHRFTRSIGAGSLGDLARDLFGFDGGAQIGLEYRFGIIAGTQIGIHRTSDRTIQFFLQHQLLRQEDSLVGIDILGTAEGTNNFRDVYSPGIGAVVSRTLGRHGAVYAVPMWVNNTNPASGDSVEDNDTVIVGLGTRLRIRPTVYLVGEVIPRSGYAPDEVYASFGIERRAGGHTFQLNFTNAPGTTMAQMARGGFGDNTWFIGFNISRKFF
jgi:Membrane bound beta barrel domain (DUF5777)